MSVAWWQVFCVICHLPFANCKSPFDCDKLKRPSNRNDEVGAGDDIMIISYNDGISVRINMTKSMGLVPAAARDPSRNPVPRKAWHALARTPWLSRQDWPQASRVDTGQPLVGASPVVMHRGWAGMAHSAWCAVRGEEKAGSSLLQWVCCFRVEGLAS